MALRLTLIALILAPGAAADNCVSSASWTKRDEPRKDCAWVGRLPEKRCDVRGAAPAGSGLGALLLARPQLRQRADAGDAVRVPGVRLGLVDDARGRARARRRLPQPVVHDLRQRREALEARRRVGSVHHPSPSPSLHHKHHITRSPTASAARAESLYLPHRPHHQTSRRPMRIDSLPLSSQLFSSSRAA